MKNPENADDSGVNRLHISASVLVDGTPPEKRSRRLDHQLGAAHALVVDTTWSGARKVANAFRVHALNHTIETLPRHDGLAIRRPSVTVGNTNPEAWIVGSTTSRMYSGLLNR
jgi:hypothetical protein